MLDLESNNFETLPESIGSLSNLKELNLYKNKLTKLPESMASLSNLSNFEINRNQPTDYPNSCRGSWTSIKPYLEFLSTFRFEDIAEKVRREETLSEMEWKCPKLKRYLPESHLNSRGKVEGYILKIISWSPAQVIEKIKANEPLGDKDLIPSKLGANSGFILEKTKEFNNQTKRQLEKYLREELSVSLGGSDLRILL